MTTVTVPPSTIEIWATKSAREEQWQVANARLKYPKHGQRILPDTPQTIHGFFTPSVAKVLHEHLGEARETAVFSHSEFAMQVSGLKLHGLRVLTRIAPDGSGSASVRFVRAQGNLSLILSEDMRGTPEPSVDVDDVTLPVLQELLCPALEVFDHILEHGLSEKDARVLAARVKTMRARRDELSDYIGLLTRFMETGANRNQKRIGHDTARAPALTLDATNTLSSRGIRWDSRNGAVRGEDASILHGHHLNRAS